MARYRWIDGQGWTATGSRARCLPDVYFREPGVEPNLADDKNPNGIFVRSKRHKAEVMAQLGVRESGDRVHGARYFHIKNPVAAL